MLLITYAVPIDTCHISLPYTTISIIGTIATMFFL